MAPEAQATGKTNARRVAEPHPVRASGDDRARDPRHRFAFALAVVFLAGATPFARPAAAQVTPDSVAMPDSTWLALTLELPIHGSFIVTRVSIREAYRGYQRAQVPMRDQFMYRIDDAEFLGCQLKLVMRRGTPAALIHSRKSTRVTVPLKSIDLESVEARGVDPSADPPVWEIFGRASDKDERPFQSAIPGQDRVTAVNTFTIPIGSRESAQRMASLLRDAAQRCDSWRTGPIRPIR